MTWKRLSSEIEAHVEEKALDLIESGVPEREVWQRARSEFGNPTAVTESSREAMGVGANCPRAVRGQTQDIGQWPR